MIKTRGASLAPDNVAAGTADESSNATAAIQTKRVAVK
jgi:hypothetical protein